MNYALETRWNEPLFGLVALSEIQGDMASMSIELEDEPDNSDTLLYVLMGDMFSLDMEVEGDMLHITGRKHDIWAWLSFATWYTADLE
jgi:hypothetical protein